MSLIKKIWNYEPRSCLKCGSFAVNKSLFCNYCFSELYEPGESLYFRNDPVETFYLFNWIPMESDSLSFLLRQLKGSQQIIAWRYYAKLFWKEIYVHNILQFEGKDVLLVPSPSKFPGQPDHAEIFCKNLSEFSGIPMASILQRKDVSEQKKKRKKDRLNDRVKLIENFSANNISGKHVIFVDDILTTGGTALAARKALGVVKNFTVWSLASRAFGCE